ncbi:MAG: 4'-phosphopantetheinyl transferase superfamily protein [Pseudomonadota bacterium]
MNRGGGQFWGGAPQWERLGELGEMAPPAPGAADIWLIRLDAPEPAGTPTSALGVEEQSRAQRFVFKKDRARFVAGRQAFRQLVSLYSAGDGAGLGKESRRAVLGYRENGQPMVEGADIAVSFSRSGGLAVAAFGCGDEGRRRLGVDLEKVGDAPDLQVTTDSHFAPTERSALAAVSEAERVRLFYCGWTAKEALLKATGEGISDRLSEISVDLSRLAGETDVIAAPPLVAFEGAAQDTSWSLATFPIDVTAIVTLAQDAPIKRLRFLHYN